MASSTLGGLAAMAALGLCLSGCATVVEGTTEQVAVDTAPVGGAYCSLRNKDGVYHVVTPGKVTVSRGSDDLRIVCSKDGYAPGTAVARSHFNAVTLGNAVAGGLIGVAVDGATGANYSYDDPITVALGAPDAPAPVAARTWQAPEPRQPSPQIAAAPPPPVPEPDTGFSRYDAYARRQAADDAPPAWGMPAD